MEDMTKGVLLGPLLVVRCCGYSGMLFALRAYQVRGCLALLQCLRPVSRSTYRSNRTYGGNERTISALLS